MPRVWKQATNVTLNIGWCLRATSVLLVGGDCVLVIRQRPRVTCHREGYVPHSVDDTYLVLHHSRVLQFHAGLSPLPHGVACPIQGIFTQAVNPVLFPYHPFVQVHTARRPNSVNICDPGPHIGSAEKTSNDNMPIPRDKLAVVEKEKNKINGAQREVVTPPATSQQKPNMHRQLKIQEAGVDQDEENRTESTAFDVLESILVCPLAPAHDPVPIRVYHDAMARMRGWRESPRSFGCSTACTGP